MSGGFHPDYADEANRAPGPVVTATSMQLAFPGSVPSYVPHNLTMGNFYGPVPAAFDPTIGRAGSSFPIQQGLPASGSYMPQQMPVPADFANHNAHKPPPFADQEDTSIALPSSSHQIPTSYDPCAHVVQVLLCYHQGGEDPEFIRKAIESLVKKLKDKRCELDALISAVTSGGKQQTSCVTIHRSLDGRLQVAGRKGVPHVVYARIWRWPNVNKGELQKLACCTTPSDHQDLICINPFHYERVVSSGLGNIDMGSLKMDPLPRLSDGDNGDADDLSESDELDKMETEADKPAEPSKSGPLLMYGPHQQPSCVVSHLPSGDTVKSAALPSFLQEPERPTPSAYESSQPHGVPTGNEAPGSTNLAPSNERNMFGMQRYDSIRYNLDRVRMPQAPSMPEHWCSITYYELDTQVGEKFKVPWDQSEVVIDGGMDPAGARSGRFCLGALSNVHRSEASEKARIHIGKGVRLKISPDGSVYLECLSQKGVFVRSYYLDFEHGLIYGSTVHKFCTGAEKKLFDLRWAYAEMCEQRQSAQMAVVAQAYAVAGKAVGVAPSLIERAGTGVDGTL
ncbi:MH2 domain containing protein [Aphelenchoides avenae]|nr:MH2 domain containing protein [Aphelenchus avenae]